MNRAVIIGAISIISILLYNESLRQYTISYIHSGYNACHTLVPEYIGLFYTCLSGMYDVANSMSMYLLW